MNTRNLALLSAGVLALMSAARAQVVELRATINAAQENPSTPSDATGSAIMLYDVATNTFDLWVTLNDFTNMISASHVHEAPSGTNGSVVTNLGAEEVYNRTGNTITGVFRGVTHGGDPLKLLQSGAYVNFHSAEFPGGEARGQLIAQPKRLTALIDVAQEQAAFPGNTYSSDSYGAAIVLYDVAGNTVDVRSREYNADACRDGWHHPAGREALAGRQAPDRAPPRRVDACRVHPGLHMGTARCDGVRAHASMGQR